MGGGGLPLRGHGVAELVFGDGLARLPRVETNPRIGRRRRMDGASVNQGEDMQQPKHPVKIRR